MNLVIVESPAKAKTINKYLGSGFEVLASYGHIRDLPSKDGSVRPDDDFAMDWETDARSKKHVSAIVDAAKRADKLILATDPDREGEAISWHVLEVLAKKKALKDLKVERVAFNAITKKAVQDAISHPRDVDQELVDAYLARRALDYLVGFTLSPVLWRKLPGSRSAGRVQSVALRLICARELEIEKFVSEEYWTIAAQAAAKEGDFPARLVRLDGEKLEKFSLRSESDAARARAMIEAARFTVADVVAKPARRNPPPPFTTSTLQQEAARKLGFSASQTMMLAQRLYEGAEVGGETTGLITYMRTDGIDMAPEAIAEARTVIGSEFGDRYVPGSPRVYKSKAKNAQEAHEAIRPTSFARRPKDLGFLEKDQLRLYELIWKRASACQMESAQFERTTIDLASEDKQTGLRATGSVVTFDGFLKLYEEGRDDPADDDENSRLPKVTVGEAVDIRDIKPEQHFTEPPPRFTEASLVKRMEELGIGRPSTYASILSVLRDRNYVQMERNRFIPEDKGRLVIAFLENFFSRYVQYDFTAQLEENLDKVSSGDLAWKTLLADFWRQFTASVDEISDLRVSQVLDALNETLGPHIFPPKEDGSDPRKCPACADGRLSLKVGKFGAFIGCSNYPECNHTRPLAPAEGDDEAASGPKALGVDPDSSLEVTLRSGRFGPYLQLGEPDPETKEKPKRAGIPRDWPLDTIDLEKALALLALPRDVGPHPEDGEPILAGIGRYGPYVQHGKTYANLASADEVFEVGINRAVTIIAEKRANPRGRGQTAKPLKELGAHPDTGSPVNVMNGRYGPYVKHEKTNATIPRGQDPQDVTMEQAVELIKAREAKGPSKKKAAKKTKKKAAKKKATKKAAKKTTKKSAKKASKTKTAAKTAAAES